MTELLQMYNEIFRPPVAYCVICLRTERERRLVALDSLELFIKSCNLPFNYTDRLHRACWVCARRAAAAHRMRQAVNLSQSLHRLFQTLRQPTLYSATASMLRGDQPKSGAALLAVQWGAQLAGVRAASALCATEVLQVSMAPGPPPRAPDLYLLPHEPPEAPEPECVLVQEDTPLVHQEEACVQHPAPPPPLVLSSDAVAQLLGCGDQMLLLQPVMLVPAGPGAAGAGGLPALGPSEVVSYCIEVQEEAGAGGTKRPASPAPRARAPPRKLPPTDWEDKIPMDVISFMDATDPLALPSGAGPRPPSGATPRPPSRAGPRPPSGAGPGPPSGAAPGPPSGAGPGRPRAPSPPPCEVIDLC